MRSTRAPVVEEANYYTPARTGSPMRGYEENEFAESMKEIISLERELENCKQTLSMRHDFNLYDAFKIFDPNNVGHIGLYDLIDGFGAYGVSLGREEG